MKKLKPLSPAIIYISTITQMEIIHGLIRKFDYSHRYFKMLEDLLSVITILPFDEKAANSSAYIKKSLEVKGTPIGSYDILIAGIAMSNKLTLVTSNAKEFSRVDELIIEDWRE